ncbi:hypothetical protein T440DRAFT_507835 [Plenodomus tracheiphilus IPT5]|uniref:Uncharacterized protein n=1 Tax=Plenodomus tracheiphilus IPT5 TaxID=1408161 RepID=A0A6A7B5Z4_9PLEO|nr:hypothetical protein T440DRAFT_507835 [Plenodomus tracheiphilus IPT5]
MSRQLNNTALSIKTDFEVQPKSSFLSLPGELRNEIYGHVFSGYTARSKDVPFPISQEKVGWIYPADGLSLSRTCRQTYNETRSLPFEKSEFSGKFTDVINQLLHKLSPTCASAITMVRLDFQKNAVIRKLHRQSDGGIVKETRLHVDFRWMLQQLAQFPHIKMVTLELKQTFLLYFLEECEVYRDMAESLTKEQMKKLGRGDVKLEIIFESSTDH